MNKSLLDTDIFSEVTKGVDQAVSRNAVAYRQAFGRYTISAVTLMESIRGLHHKQRVREVQILLASVAAEEVLDFDGAAAKLAGRIGGDLARMGKPIGLADTMIASIALSHGLGLATGNTSHFQYVQQAGYPLLLSNWRFPL